MNTIGVIRKVWVNGVFQSTYPPTSYKYQNTFDAQNRLIKSLKYDVGSPLPGTNIESGMRVVYPN